MENLQNKNLLPKLKTGRWTRAEHNKFMQALEKHGRNWILVQRKVKTRSLLQIRSHAQKVFLNMFEKDIDALIGHDDSQASLKGESKGKKNKTEKIGGVNSVLSPDETNQKPQQMGNIEECEQGVQGECVLQQKSRLNQTFEFERKNSHNQDGNMFTNTQQGNPRHSEPLNLSVNPFFFHEGLFPCVWSPFLFYPTPR